MRQKIKATVVRGFITRFVKETEWEEELYPMAPGAELVDGDAVSYYVQREDGKFHECYDYYASPGVVVYEKASNVEHTMEKTINTTVSVEITLDDVCQYIKEAGGELNLVSILRVILDKVNPSDVQALAVLGFGNKEVFAQMANRCKVLGESLLEHSQG
jgi:hypothetical protein